MPPPAHSPLKVVILFLFTFLALHFLWQQAKGTAVERLWVDQATVTVVVGAINTLAPDTHAQAQGPRIHASGGGINVLNGCEGTDLLFLLYAGFIAFPMNWRRRTLALGLGMAFIFVLNELRILLLFFVIRSDKALFDLLHTTIMPMFLIVAIAIYFYAWIHRERHLAIAS